MNKNDRIKEQFYKQGISNSELYLQAKASSPPVLSANVAKQVSDYRRAQLTEQIANGEFREPGVPLNYPTNYQNLGLTSLGKVTSLSTPIKKTASYSNYSSSGGAAGSGGSSWRGTGGSTVQMPEVYSPLWLNSNLNLPRDRATVNAWCRSFFALNPIVQNAISLHSTYPISKLNIKCKDRKIEQFFGEMIEEIDLMNVCVSIAQEYWTLGEAIVYAELDDRTAKWSRLLIQNPDYVHIKRSVIAGEPIISLRPDENLKRIVNSNRQEDRIQREQLSKSIIDHVRRGENIPLNNFYVSHLARKVNPYEIRGTSLIVSSFRYLMLLDLLFESKFAQAHNMINPITLVKVGSENYKPSQTDLEAWREIFEAAQYNKDFKIFTHEAVTIEKIGSQGGILDISGDIDKLLKFIYIGLMVPQVLMDGGSDTTYTNGGIALDVLRQRYMTFRNMLSMWLKRKIFAPISEINEFYEYVDGKKTLIVPDIDWNHMSLFDVESYINNLVGLATAEPSKLSIQTLYRSLGIEWEDERRKIRREDIANVIRKKELEALEKLPLNELRAITDDDEIKEVLNSADKNQDPYEEGGDDLPGVSPEGDMGGLSGLPGVPPDLSGPPSAGGNPSPSPIGSEPPIG